MEFPYRLLPINIKKHQGAIHASSKGFKVRVGKSRVQKEVFSTYEEAFAFLLSRNGKAGNPIRNIIYEHRDYLVVELTRGRTMKCSKEDILLVDNYLWYFNGKHAVAKIGENILRFDRVIKGDLPFYHLDGDDLNNRRTNLIYGSPPSYSTRKP